MRFRWRPWLALSAVSVLGAAAACIPDPQGDFEDYQARIKTYVPPAPTDTTSGGTSSGAPSDGDGGPSAQIDSGPPPVEVTEATYFASCLSELAGGNVKKTFSFLAKTRYTPNQDTTTGGTLVISLGALRLGEGNLPPTTISSANIVSTLPDISGTTNAAGSFIATTTEVATFLGAANPISGSDVQISRAGLKGRFIPAAFCARLFGYVDRPEAASRDLAEGKNQCLFTPITEGGTAPEGRVASSYAADKCPL